MDFVSDESQKYIGLKTFPALDYYYFFPNLPQPFPSSSFPFPPPEKETADAFCVCALQLVTWTSVSEG